MDDVVLLIGDLIMFGGAAGGVVFAASYMSLFSWRKTQAGRALLYFVASLIAVFVSNLTARTFGVDYPAREWVRLAVYTAVAVSTWRLVVVLWRNWRTEKPPLELEPRKEKESP